MAWRRGEQILWCFQREAWPVTVVADDAEALVVWLAAGTVLLSNVPVDGRPLRDRPLHERFKVDRKFDVRAWIGNGILMVSPHSAAHSLWRFTDDDGRMRGWYANLEAPHWRTPRATHTRDHVLDVWFDADGTCRFKDEDELAAGVEVGRFTLEDAAAIRAEGERLIANWPRSTRWDDWTPPGPDASDASGAPAPALPDALHALHGQPASPEAILAFCRHWGSSD
ncbi:MAG: hypothetical protein QOI20_2802 [Acidimicrobiaceae bacterium]|jgi:hypothetical protein|nr:hypothetical protein [Acidimicrobiaceae bacterium]